MCVQVLKITITNTLINDQNYSTTPTLAHIYIQTYNIYICITFISLFFNPSSSNKLQLKLQSVQMQTKFDVSSLMI